MPAGVGAPPLDTTSLYGNIVQRFQLVVVSISFKFERVPVSFHNLHGHTPVPPLSFL